jgi:hypothetical protein
MGWIPYSSAQCQWCVGPYFYNPSWSVLKTGTTQDLRQTILIHIGEPPGRAEAQVPFSGNQVRWTGGEIPSNLIRSQGGGVMMLFVTVISLF